MNASIDALSLVDMAPDWVTLHRICKTRSDWTPLPGLVRLRCWPDLADVPDEYVASVSRLCGLLWKKPTASHLIPIMMGGNRTENIQTLQMLGICGYVELLVLQGSSVVPQSLVENHPTEASNSGLSSLIGKLRLRLLG